MDNPGTLQPHSRPGIPGTLRLSSTWRGLRACLLAIAALSLFMQCNSGGTTSSPAENFVSIKLNDSLSRFDSVSVLIVAAGDTSRVIGKAWSGPLPNPKAIPDFRLADGTKTIVSIHVLGYKNGGAVVLSMLMSNQAGVTVVQQFPQQNIPPNKDPTATATDPKSDTARTPVPANTTTKPTTPPQGTDLSTVLANLTPSAGSLSPAFNPALHEYTLTLASTASTVSFTATLVSTKASLAFNGALLDPRTTSPPIMPAIGNKSVAVQVSIGADVTIYTVKVVWLPIKGGDTGAKYSDPRNSGGGTWKYRTRIAVNGQSLGLGAGIAVRNAPLLIRLTGDNFKFSEADSLGNDIRFSKADGTPLDYEVSRWDAQALQAEIWVRVDTVYCDDTTRIRMYWGNPAATSAADSKGVFQVANGFNGVWHLGESPKGAEGEFKDAVGRNDGTGGGGNANYLTTRIAAVTGFGQDFGSPNCKGTISIPNAMDPGPSGWTFQSWVRVRGSNEGVLFSKCNGADRTHGRFQIVVKAGNGHQLALASLASICLTNVYLPDNASVLLTIVYDGQNADFYVDGFLRESHKWTQDPDSTAAVTIGSDAPSDIAAGFQGYLDEVWISSTPRKPEWTRLAFENQKTTTNLISMLPFVSAE